MKIKNIPNLWKINSKKTREKVIVILVCLSISAILYNVIGKINNINQEEGKKSGDYFLNINKRFQFTIYTLNGLKSDEQVNRFILENGKDRENQYLKSVLHRKIVSENTIYGSMGYSLNYSKSDVNYYVTSNGLDDKKNFYSVNNFSDDIEKKERSISSDKNSINIFIKDKNYLEDNSNLWVLKLDRNIFFYDYDIEKEAENWYLKIDKTINLSNLDSKKINEISKKIDNLPKKESSFREIIKINGRKLHMFYLSDIDAGLYYYQPSINIIKIVFVETVRIAVLVILVYLAIAFIINSIIKPFSELANKIGYKEGDKSELGEIGYIETKFKELNTTNLELAGQVNELSEIRRIKRLKDALTGISYNNETEIGKILWTKKYRVILIEIHDVDFENNVYDNFRISNEFVKKYFLNEISFDIVNIDFKSMVIIIEDIEKENLIPVLDNLINHIERNFSLYFIAAISDTYYEFKNLSYAYRKTKKIMEYKHIYKQNKIIFEDMINENNFSKYYYPIQLEAKLIAKVLGSNVGEVKKIIKEIFGDDKEQKLMDKKEIKEFSRLLYNTLNRIFIQLEKMEIGKIDKKYDIEKILEISSISELKDKFENILFKVCQFTRENSEIDLKTIKESIEKYVSKNYMKDISLENLSDYLGYSFKYTSILFKKIMDDNFKNFLSLYRIKKAKELMENGEYKIKELAELVGYNSSNTFIRMFRKYEGVSPGKYFFGNESKDE